MTTPKKIELIARALISRGGKVLVCRSVEAGHCYLPGGHVEPGESAHDALIREMDEETGAIVRVGDLALIQEHRFQQGGRERHEINLVFHVELANGQGEVISREPEIAFEWVQPSDLAQARFVPADLLDAIKFLALGAERPDAKRRCFRPTAVFLGAAGSNV